MTPADETEFVKVIMALSAMKPGKPLTPEGIELFWNSMQGWSLADFKAAAGHLNRTCEFMPNPYHFEQLRKAGRMTAGEAFELAREAVKYSMPSEWPSLTCGNGLVDSAIRGCGGYEALAMCTSSNIGFFERRFAEHYESGTDASDVRGALPMLTTGERLNGPVGIRKVVAKLGEDTFA